jgi:hypothetical protein
MVHTSYNGLLITLFTTNYAAGSIAAPYIAGPPALFNVASDQSFDFVQQWILECDTRHDSCVKVAPCPTNRLIDVSTFKGTGDVRLKSEHLDKIKPFYYTTMPLYRGKSAKIYGTIIFNTFKTVIQETITTAITTKGKLFRTFDNSLPVAVDLLSM